MRLEVHNWCDEPRVREFVRRSNRDFLSRLPSVISIIKREGRIVGLVQQFAKLSNLNGFREFESHPSRQVLQRTINGCIAQ